MKVIAVLENTIRTGGGFHQGLSAIVQMQRVCERKFEFEVFTTRHENIDSLRKIGVNATTFSFTVVDNLLAILSLSVWWQAIQRRVKLLGSFEKKLIARGCDLVYFVNPSEKSGALQRLNYIMTVWDICHRDMVEFPEVRNFNRFHARERFLRNHLSPAAIVVVDSSELANSISLKYGVDRARILPMPFTPAQFLISAISTRADEVLKKYNLVRGYFFYPAQFWAHKNHIRILEALLVLRKSGTQLTAVFAGGDQENQTQVERFVIQHKLMEQVRFLGFVPSEDMRGLYDSCRAVIMPTYFGPTNLPPLEAWTMGKPLIYSSQFSTQTANAAILIDADNAEDVAAAMNACLDNELCEEMIRRGKLRLQEIDYQRKEAEFELLEKLIRFEKRLQCWQQK